MFHKIQQTILSRKIKKDVVMAMKEVLRDYRTSPDAMQIVEKIRKGRSSLRG